MPTFVSASIDFESGRSPSSCSPSTPESTRSVRNPGKEWNRDPLEEVENGAGQSQPIPDQPIGAIHARIFPSKLSSSSQCAITRRSPKRRSPPARKSCPRSPTWVTPPTQTVPCAPSANSMAINAKSLADVVASHWLGRLLCAVLAELSNSMNMRQK